MEIHLATLSGKNVLVIGGSSGIGYATAAGALAEGAKVTIDSRSEEMLRNTFMTGSVVYIDGGGLLV